MPSTPDFPTEYQIRRHSNPARLPTFAAIWGPDFRASIIRLTCPHMFKQIKQIRITLMTMFKVNPGPPNEVGQCCRPMQRRGTRADSHRGLLVVYSARGFLARFVCFEGATPDFQCL